LGDPTAVNKCEGRQEHWNKNETSNFGVIQ